MTMETSDLWGNAILSRLWPLPTMAPSFLQVSLLPSPFQAPCSVSESRCFVQAGADNLI